MPGSFTTSPCDRQAQVLKTSLARIGVDLEIRTFAPNQLFDHLGRPHEPYDLAFEGWFPDWVDPYQFLNILLGGRTLKAGFSFNLARFDSPRFNQLLARASRLSGRARFRAYGRIDVEATRDAAPYATYMNLSNVAFVSKRVGCFAQDRIDLAAVCLR